MSKNVNFIKENGLCTTCGMCKAVCPKDCIEYKRDCGMYLPVIDQSLCTDCGLCLDVCPNKCHTYSDGYDHVREQLFGDYEMAVNAWSKDDDIRFRGASGGVITTLLKKAFEEHIIDIAFCVDTYKYQHLLKSSEYDGVHFNRELSRGASTQKSRYVCVSHENAVKYVIKNPSDKVAFIGTSCAVRGFLNVIERFKLKRENYLIIGLFCDKVYRYDINEYYSERDFCEGKQLDAFHFKNKESGGWPGDMKFIFSDETHKYVSKDERMKMKPYFIPEMCLYCMDKLNVYADISIGDNYTTQNSTSAGSNSVIIRTSKGYDVWLKLEADIESYPVDPSLILDGQYISGRMINQFYAYEKSMLITTDNQPAVVFNKGLMPIDFSGYDKKIYKQAVIRMNAGAKYCDNPLILKKQIALDEKRKTPSFIMKYGKRVLGKLRRHIIKR